MKRILPGGRIIGGFLLLVLVLFFFFILFPTSLKMDKDFLFMMILFIIGFSISINLIISHIAFDSEKLVYYSLFRIKKIKLSNIIQITRDWEGSGKYTQLKYYIYHNNENNKKNKTRIYLPENYESKRVKEFFEAIKKQNDDFVFKIGISYY